MRCLALAQHWRDAGGRSVLATANNLPRLTELLESNQVKISEISEQPGSIEDAQALSGLAKSSLAGWIVVDGYHFDSNYQRTLKESGANVLFVDDLCSAGHYYADIVLNQNLYANEHLYTNREPYTRLLLGTHYVLLRKEFNKWMRWQRKLPQTAGKLLVTMGGNAPDSLILKVILGIQQLSLTKFETLIVEPNNSKNENIDQLIRQSKTKIRVKRAVSSMSDLMAWADLAVSAGGNTSWEIAFMGLPALSIIRADNQYRVVKELEKAGAVTSIGWQKNLTSTKVASKIEKMALDLETRTEMSKNAKSIVDGYGAQRVIAELERNPD